MLRLIQVLFVAYDDIGDGNLLVKGVVLGIA